MIFEAAEDGASDIHVEPHEQSWSSATGSTASSTSPTASGSGSRPVSPPASRCWRSSTSPSGGKPQDGRISLNARGRPHARLPRGDAPRVHGESVDDAAPGQVSRGARRSTTLGLPKLVTRAAPRHPHPALRELSSSPARPAPARPPRSTPALRDDQSAGRSTSSPSRTRSSTASTSHQMEINLGRARPSQPRRARSSRADPDVIMVGEIRDDETATICEPGRR